jgi:hypothetical protein
MDHGLDADFVAHLNAIAVAGDLGPIGELAAGAEDVFLFVGAEKIGAVFVPEGRVMKHAAGHNVADGVDELWRVGENPAIDGNLPDQIRGLRHFHMTGVRRQIHRADAYGNCVAIDLLLQLHAFGHRVVHAALHEAAMLHVLHVVRGISGLVLSKN